MEIAMQVIGGLGLFLYGMTLMGDGLQKAAGRKLKAIVGALTKSTIRGIIVGAFVTAMIQSSAATTIMVVGFVNAGIMTLAQALGVIMGANIGTTMTGILIALNLNQYAPLLIGIGTLLLLTGKSKTVKATGEAILGFGILFFGMMTMEGGLAPLGNTPFFVNAIATLQSPVVGVLVGFVATAMVQSSSVIVGIVQALGMQNLITIGAAFPILLGSNIGSTITAAISSMGAHRTAKRAAFLHFIFNVIGSMLFLVLFVLFKEPFVNFMESNFSSLPSQIAISHFGFNILNTLLLYPFTRQLVALAEKVIPGSDIGDEFTVYLDERMLKTPSIALGQAMQETLRMGDLVKESQQEVKDLIINNKAKNYESIMEREKVINSMQRSITNYLVALSRESLLNDSEHKEIDDLLYMINDIERVGDHIKNICELYEDIENDEIIFSQDGLEELGHMFDACENVFKTAIEAFVEKDEGLAQKAFDIEDSVDQMEETYRQNHIRRLANKYVDAAPGIVFLDCISNLERISDHSNNIASYVVNKDS